MNIHSLRFRLSWTNGVVLTVVLLCVGFTRYATISYQVYRHFDNELGRDAVFLSSRLLVTPGTYVLRSDSLSAYDKVNLQEIQAYSVITDAQGYVVHPDTCSRYVREMLQQNELTEVLKARSGIVETTAADGSRFRFASLPVGKDPDSPYVLHVGRDAQSVDGAACSNTGSCTYSQSPCSWLCPWWWAGFLPGGRSSRLTRWRVRWSR